MCYTLILLTKGVIVGGIEQVGLSCPKPTDTSHARIISANTNGGDQRMYKIVERKPLNPTVVQLQIEAPLVANKAKPGQFIILRVDENGERIPLTIAGVNKDAILGHDLYLVCRDGGTTVGAKDEFISSPRLDDLGCAFGCLEGFLAADESDAVAVYCLFDNEEVGSSTRQGAASTLLQTALERIAAALDCDAARLLERSFLVSADNAHAIHPNHPELSDAHNAPVLNGGVVIKYNANQRYTTNGISAALFTQLCRDAGVSVQRYANRSDLPGGSTLGSIATTQTPMLAVDIGLGQLAMHSCYETMGSADYAQLVQAMTAFYSKSLATGSDSWQLV